MENVSIVRKFAKDIGIAGVGNILIRLSGIILLPILTKTLSVFAYGIWVQVNVTTSMISLLATLGLLYSMTRFLAPEKDRAELQENFYTITGFVLIISLIISSFFIVFSDFIAEMLFDGAVDVVRILGLIILMDCLDSVYLNFFRTLRQIGRYSIFTIVQAFGDIGLTSYMIFLGFGIFSIVISILVIRGLLFLIMFYLVISEIGLKLPKFSKIREFLKFGLPTLPLTISSWVVVSSDRYIIAYFLGVTFVGSYSAGYALGNIITLFLLPFGVVLFPYVSKLYDEGKEDDVKTILRYSLKYFLLFAIPSVFGLSLFSKQLLTIFSTPEIAFQGYIITPFIALSNLLYGMYVFFVQPFFLVEKTKVLGITWIASAAVNLGLNIVFVPRIGIIGAAITTLIAYTVSVTIAAHYSPKYFTFDIDKLFILKSIAASIMPSIVIIAFQPTGILEILLLSGIYAVVYVAILFVLKSFTTSEIQFLKELLTNFG